MAMAARACAALRNSSEVSIEDLFKVAPLALQHRRPGFLEGSAPRWTDEMTGRVKELLAGPTATPTAAADVAPAGRALQAPRQEGANVQ
jgi:hypothetical protein